MAKGLKYFIGNWKMFGIPSSIKILDRIDEYFKKNRNHNSKYKIIIAVPFTLLESFSKRFKNKNIIISAQNCHYNNNFGAYTGSINSFMIKKMNINYTIIGHSENRATGESDKIIEKKVSSAMSNNFNIIFCIGENYLEKRNKKTLSVLKKQMSTVLKKKYNFKKIFIAYEPIWSIGTGKVPQRNDLMKISNFVKNFVKKRFKLNHKPKFIYGGSVDKKTVLDFKTINELDGFLIGGASKSSKKFIDIIKNFYK